MTLPEFPVSTEVLLVIATLVGIMALSAIVKAWTMRQWPFVAFVSFAVAVALGAYVHMTKPEGLVWHDIPDAFILVVAKVLN